MMADDQLIRKDILRDEDPIQHALQVQQQVVAHAAHHTKPQ
jgi:hypothetical protein